MLLLNASYQGRGIGTKLINKLLEQVKEGLHEDEEVLIELLSASGKTDFYRQFGFKDKKRSGRSRYVFMGKKIKSRVIYFFSLNLCYHHQ